MKKVIALKAFPAFLLLVSTLPIHADNQPSKKFLAYISCVDAKATTYITEGNMIDESIKNGIADCKKTFKKYVWEVLNSSKRKGGWRSLHSSVKPAVEDRIREDTLFILRTVYQKSKHEAS